MRSEAGLLLGGDGPRAQVPAGRRGDAAVKAAVEAAVEAAVGGGGYAGLLGLPVRAVRRAVARGWLSGEAVAGMARSGEGTDAYVEEEVLRLALRAVSVSGEAALLAYLAECCARGRARRVLRWVLRPFSVEGVRAFLRAFTGREEEAYAALVYARPRMPRGLAGLCFVGVFDVARIARARSLFECRAVEVGVVEFNGGAFERLLPYCAFRRGVFNRWQAPAFVAEMAPFCDRADYAFYFAREKIAAPEMACCRRDYEAYEFFRQGVTRSNLGYIVAYRRRVGLSPPFLTFLNDNADKITEIYMVDPCRNVARAAAELLVEALCPAKQAALWKTLKAQPRALKGVYHAFPQEIEPALHRILSFSERAQQRRHRHATDEELRTAAAYINSGWDAELAVFFAGASLSALLPLINDWTRKFFIRLVLARLKDDTGLSVLLNGPKGTAALAHPSAPADDSALQQNIAVLITLLDSAVELEDGATIRNAYRRLIEGPFQAQSAVYSASDRCKSVDLRFAVAIANPGAFGRRYCREALLKNCRARSSTNSGPACEATAVNPVLWASQEETAKFLAVHRQLLNLKNGVCSADSKAPASCHLASETRDYKRKDGSSAPQMADPASSLEIDRILETPFKSDESLALLFPKLAEVAPNSSELILHLHSVSPTDFLFAATLFFPEDAHFYFVALFKRFCAHLSDTVSKEKAAQPRSHPSAVDPHPVLQCATATDPLAKARAVLGHALTDPRTLYIVLPAVVAILRTGATPVKMLLLEAVNPRALVREQVVEYFGACVPLLRGANGRLAELAGHALRALPVETPEISAVMGEVVAAFTDRRRVAGLLTTLLETPFNNYLCFNSLAILLQLLFGSLEDCADLVFEVLERLPGITTAVDAAQTGRAVFRRVAAHVAAHRLATARILSTGAHYAQYAEKGDFAALIAHGEHQHVRGFLIAALKAASAAGNVAVADVVAEIIRRYEETAAVEPCGASNEASAGNSCAESRGATEPIASALVAAICELDEAAPHIRRLLPLIGSLFDSGRPADRTAAESVFARVAAMEAPHLAAWVEPFLLSRALFGDYPVRMAALPLIANKTVIFILRHDSHLQVRKQADACWKAAVRNTNTALRACGHGVLVAARFCAHPRHRQAVESAVVDIAARCPEVIEEAARAFSLCCEDKSVGGEADSAEPLFRLLTAASLKDVAPIVPAPSSMAEALEFSLEACVRSNKILPVALSFYSSCAASRPPVRLFWLLCVRAELRGKLLEASPCTALLAACKAAGRVEMAEDAEDSILEASEGSQSVSAARQRPKGVSATQKKAVKKGGVRAGNPQGGASGKLSLTESETERTQPGRHGPSSALLSEVATHGFLTAHRPEFLEFIQSHALCKLATGESPLYLRCAAAAALPDSATAEEALKEAPGVVIVHYLARSSRRDCGGLQQLFRRVFERGVETIHLTEECEEQQPQIAGVTGSACEERIITPLHPMSGAVHPTLESLLVPTYLPFLTSCTFTRVKDTAALLDLLLSSDTRACFERVVECVSGRAVPTECLFPVLGYLFRGYLAETRRRDVTLALQHMSAAGHNLGYFTALIERYIK